MSEQEKELAQQVKALTERVAEMERVSNPPGGIGVMVGRRRLVDVIGDIRIGDGVRLAGPLHLNSRLSSPDRVAVGARKSVEDSITKSGSEDIEGQLKKFLTAEGITTKVRDITNRMDAMALDETARYLLSSGPLYAGLMLAVLKAAADKGDKSKLERFVGDPAGVVATMRDKLDEDEGSRHRFAREIAKAALARRRIILDESKVADRRLIAHLRQNPPPLSEGRLLPAVERTWDNILGKCDFRTLVDAYVERKEIDSQRFTEPVRRAMVEYLIARGVKINPNDANDQNRFDLGEFDEYFALAYEHATSTVEGGDDPIDAAWKKGAEATWDFTVNRFEAMEEQGVVKENILAAGALDYLFEMGERLGIFRLADALTLNWAAGTIDVVDGPCAAKLYRYWKLRDQRSDPAERGLVYKRVLNKGEADVLERMVVNEPFPSLWGELMQKVAEYIEKVESAKADSRETLLVSRRPIYQAIRDLQYNLTEFCTGMAHMQIREMYAQLQEAMQLLGDPEIVDHYAGGRRKSMWTVIERLSRSEFGSAPNISAIRTAAVEGNTVFRYIASFQPGGADDDFQKFIEAAEAWIIAKGSDEGGLDHVGAEEEEDSDDDFGDGEGE